MLEMAASILCVYKSWLNLFKYYLSALESSRYLWRHDSVRNFIIIFASTM